MIKRATAEYTGGGIWTFYGELDDGNFFITDDAGETILLDEEPVYPDSWDDSWDDGEWLTDHKIRDILSEDELRKFWDVLLEKLVELKEVDKDFAKVYRNFFEECLTMEW